MPSASVPRPRSTDPQLHEWVTGVTGMPDPGTPPGMRISEILVSKPERARRAAARKATAEGSDPQAARDAVDAARKHAGTDGANAAAAAAAVYTIGPSA